MDFLLLQKNEASDDATSIAFLSAASSMFPESDFPSSTCVIEVVSNLVDVFMYHDQAAKNRVNAMLRCFAIALLLSKDIIMKEDFVTSRNFSKSSSDNDVLKHRVSAECLFVSAKMDFISTSISKVCFLNSATHPRNSATKELSRDVCMLQEFP